MAGRPKRGAMRRFTWRWMRRAVYLVVGIVGLIFIVRAYEAWNDQPLQPWHTVTLDEVKAGEINRLDWAGYIAAETRLFAQMRREVTDRLEPEQRFIGNRYYAESPNYPARFAQDWNHSYILEPEGTSRGAVVLLHGLTDSPYSMRHIAQRYRELGFVAIGLRLPGHGTLPSGLATAVWEDWTAATRLAMREARRRVPTGPLHLVGYSTGGALAVQHAMSAIEDATLFAPDRLVLLSPMIAVTRFARFAGLAGLPAFLPAFASAAWLGILPEFNPFKYNSFAVNAGRQSFQLTQVLQAQLQRLVRDGRMQTMPPILAFQSVRDSTVTARAVVQILFAALPANGSELVLMDINQTTPLDILLAADADDLTARHIPPAPHPWRLTLFTNAARDTDEVVARTMPPGATSTTDEALDLRYPPDVYSLSHVALPFPPEDSLYGGAPTQRGEFGVSLGTLAARGESGTLIMSLDTLLRMSWNPFFPAVLARIEAAAR